MNILLVEDMPAFGKHMQQLCRAPVAAAQALLDFTDQKGSEQRQGRQDHQRFFTGFPLLDGEASNAQASAGGA